VYGLRVIEVDDAFIQSRKLLDHMVKYFVNETMIPRKPVEVRRDSIVRAFVSMAGLAAKRQDDPGKAFSLPELD